MNWPDLVVLILLGTMAAAEVKRGFGMALLTAAGALLSLKLAIVWAAPVSQALHLKPKPGPNEALALILVFVGLMAVVQGIVYVVRPDTFLSLDPFDNMFGGICGLITGWAAAYALYAALQTWGAADLVQSSIFAQEIQHFKTYHKVVDHLRHIGEDRQGRYLE